MLKRLLLCLSLIAGTLIYISPLANATGNLILNYDLDDPASYSGSGNNIINTVGTGSSPSQDYAQIFGGNVETETAGNFFRLIGDENTYILTRSDIYESLRGLSYYKVSMKVRITGSGVILSELGAPNKSSQWHDSQIEATTVGVPAGQVKLRMGIWPTRAITGIETVTALNQWVELTFSYTGGKLTGYVDGVEINPGGTTSTHQSPWANQSSSVYFGIGRPDSTSLSLDAGAGNFDFKSLKVYSDVASVTAAKTTPTITNFADLTKFTTDSSFNLSPSSGGVSGTFTFSSSDTSVATVESATVTILTAGSSRISTFFNPTDTSAYETATASLILTVNQGCDAACLAARAAAAAPRPVPTPAPEPEPTPTPEAEKPPVVTPEPVKPTAPKVEPVKPPAPKVEPVKPPAPKVVSNAGAKASARAVSAKRAILVLSGLKPGTKIKVKIRRSR